MTRIQTNVLELLNIARKYGKQKTVCVACSIFVEFLKHYGREPTVVNFAEETKQEESVQAACYCLVFPLSVFNPV